MTLPRITIVFIALAALLAVLPLAASRAADPAPSLTVSAAAQPFAIDIGDDARLEFVVTNTVGLLSGPVVLTAVLPAERVQRWEVISTTFSSGCNIDADDVLSCVGAVPGRHLDPYTLIPVNGSASVVVEALALRCGELLTRARVDHEWDEETEALRSPAVSVLVRGCETPTPAPTATQPPSTNTPVPPPATNTIVPAFTPTPTAFHPTVTPTPIRFVPLPPNTGTGYADEVPWGNPDSGGRTGIALGVVLVAASLGLWAARRAMRRAR